MNVLKVSGFNARPPYGERILVPSRTMTPRPSWAASLRFLEQHRRAALRYILGVLLVFTFFRMAALKGWDYGFSIAQAVSLASDQDLLLHDDLLLLNNPMHDQLRMLLTVRPDGALQNTFSIGPAVTDLPYLWPLLSRRQGSSGHIRYSIAIASMGILVVTILGIVLLVTRYGTGPRHALAAAVLSVTFGPLAVYGTREYLGSHLLSALWVTVFFLGVLKWLSGGEPWYALLAGLGAGLVTITRWQDVVIPIAFVPMILLALVRHRKPRALWTLAVFGMACMAVFAIQMLAWQRQYGSLILIPQGSGFMRWRAPEIAKLLLSPFHGLLPWLPGLALGLSFALFIPFSVKTSIKGLRLGVVVSILLTIYTSAAAADDWYGGASYGPRRLSSLTPFAALGLAAAFTRLHPYLRRVIVIGLVGWTWFTVTALYSGFDDLAVLFTGRVHSSNPYGIGRYAHAAWIDQPAALPILLRPGFTFSDAPTNADRIVGLAVTALVVALVAWAWLVLTRSWIAQRAVVAAAATWVLVCLLLLLVEVPDNARWNRQWIQVVTGRVSIGDLPSLPIGMQNAARLVLAAHAEESGHSDAALAYLHPPPMPNTYQVLRDALEDVRLRAFLRRLRASQPGQLPPAPW